MASASPSQQPQGTALTVTAISTQTTQNPAQVQPPGSELRVRFPTAIASPQEDETRNPPTKSTKPKKFLDDIHRCPACAQSLCYELSGLSMQQNFQMYKKDAEYLRKRREDQWEGKRTKSDSDMVVVATCGELFHKSCLVKVCTSIPQDQTASGDRSRGGGGGSRLVRNAKCPRCERLVEYNCFLPIDTEGHRAKSYRFDKDLNQLRLDNQDLVHQKKKQNSILRKLTKRLDKMKALSAIVKAKEAGADEKIPPAEHLQEAMEKAKKNRETKAWMENYIEKAQQVIEFMQKEAPKTMRIYLDKVLSGPLDEIHKNTSIPRMLIPYLYNIYQDNYSLSALSQIVKPHPYPGASFEEDELLMGILNKVNPSLAETLTAQIKKFGNSGNSPSLMQAYDAMFPDNCLEALRSQRNLRLQEEKRRNDSGLTLKDSSGKELAITIMYMLDELESGDFKDIEIPATEHIIAEKASNSRFDSSSTSLIEVIDLIDEEILPPESYRSCSASVYELQSNSKTLSREDTIFIKKNETFDSTTSFFVEPSTTSTIGSDNPNDSPSAEVSGFETEGTYRPNVLEKSSAEDESIDGENNMNELLAWNNNVPDFII